MDLTQSDNALQRTSSQEERMEILLFGLGEETYGINVGKVREVIRQCRVTPAPEQPFAVLGMIDLRGHVLPLVDLTRVLDVQSNSPDDQKRVIVTEFYDTQAGFLVDRVEHIHRVPLEALRPMKESLEDDTAVTSMLDIDGRLVMMLDFEAIIEQLDARHQLSVAAPPPAELGVDRGQIRIFLAEDSQTIRRQITSTLAAGGYTQVTTFNNGKDCWEAIENARAVNTIPFDLVISDIEMPQMDGYGLCRRIKGDAQLADKPVFLFSSMISDRTRFRGEELGADEQITKPQLPALVEIIDRWAPQLVKKPAA